MEVKTIYWNQFCQFLKHLKIWKTATRCPPPLTSTMLWAGHRISSPTFFYCNNVQDARGTQVFVFNIKRKFLLAPTIWTRNILLINSVYGAVHKLRLQEEVCRWSKKSTFCKLLFRRKYRGLGGQKKTNLVNVVCERPLSVFYVFIKSFFFRIGLSKYMTNVFQN